MDYNEAIKFEQERINTLKNQIKNISLPKTTINYQFQNLRGINCNDSIKRKIVKREKSKLNNEIGLSNFKIKSYKESIFENII